MTIPEFETISYDEGDDGIQAKSGGPELDARRTADRGPQDVAA